MKLSILVPVYNAERFLPDFFRCLLAQGLSDAEVIFVDDCSMDSSLRLLQEFAKGDVGLLSVHIIALERNGGVSEARQKALDAASGDFVIFSDPDDTMDVGMYSGLIDKAINAEADLVWEDLFENGSRRSQAYKVSNGEDFIVSILLGRMHGSTCNKLIRYSFLQKSGARFLSGRVGLCEDVDFLCQVLAAKPKCVYHDDCHYRYRRVEGSATHSKDARQMEALGKVGEHLSTILTTTRTRAALNLWRFGNYAAPKTGLRGKVLHVAYRLGRFLI